MPETNRHFTPELSICALGDLTMSNLAYTVNERRDQQDATNSDLLVINCSSTCFGRLYAHHQEVRLRFTAYDFLSCGSCCDAGESGGFVKQHPLHSARISPSDSPASQQLPQDRKP
jgi:ferredoxin-like protein FixX